MAVDTETKRRAAGCSPAASIFPVADGTIDAFDRAVAGWIYRNTAAPPIVKVIDEIMDFLEPTPLIRRLRTSFEKLIVAIGY